MEFAEVRKIYFLQCFITESLFHQSLTIVEIAVYFQRTDIFAARGKLPFLHPAHFARGIKDYYTHTRDPVKTTCHRSTRVARSGDQYRQFFITFF